MILQSSHPRIGATSSPKPRSAWGSTSRSSRKTSGCAGPFDRCFRYRPVKHQWYSRAGRPSRKLTASSSGSPKTSTSSLTSTSILPRGIEDPETASSRTQQLERMDSLDVACANYIGGELTILLRKYFAERLGTDTGWDLLLDPLDRYAHTLLFRYPISAPDVEHSYIRGRVKIELGWRSTTARANRARSNRMWQTASRISSENPR